MANNSPEYKKSYFEKNKENIRLQDRKRYQRDKEKRLKLCKAVYKKALIANPNKHNEYYQKNKQRIQERRKELKAADPEKYRKKEREYAKNRRNIDPYYAMKMSLRTRITKIFSLHNVKKRTSTTKLLGVDFSIVKKHLEKQFTKGISWDNYGKWHIDHITPLASAKTPEELIGLCHYTNLQPLWAAANIAKKDKIPQVQLKIAI